MEFLDLSGESSKAFESGILCSGCPAPGLVKKKYEIRKLRIEKIGKIGDFVLKNRRKIGKSIVLSSTKAVFLHPIRVVTKATSAQLLHSQDLDQLSLLRRSDQ